MTTDTPPQEKDCCSQTTNLKIMSKAFENSYYTKTPLSDPQVKGSPDLLCVFSNENKTVFIMRGISGSGKSHYVQGILQAPGNRGKSKRVCSADHFFDGREFDPFLLGQAHATCMRVFLDAVGEGIDIVILDNTNICKWEYENYETIAKMLGYQVEIIEITVDSIRELCQCADRNVHAVPKSVVANQAMRFERDSKARHVRFQSS